MWTSCYQISCWWLTCILITEVFFLRLKCEVVCQVMLLGSSLESGPDSASAPSAISTSPDEKSVWMKQLELQVHCLELLHLRRINCEIVSEGEPRPDNATVHFAQTARASRVEPICKFIDGNRFEKAQNKLESAGRPLRVHRRRFLRAELEIEWRSDADDTTVQKEL